MAKARQKGVKGLLKNATGCPFWVSTAPMPIPEASVSTVNGMVKSERARVMSVIEEV